MKIAVLFDGASKHFEHPKQLCSFLIDPETNLEIVTFENGVNFISSNLWDKIVGYPVNQDIISAAFYVFPFDEKIKRDNNFYNSKTTDDRLVNYGENTIRRIIESINRVDLLRSISDNHQGFEIASICQSQEDTIAARKARIVSIEPVGLI